MASILYMFIAAKCCATETLNLPEGHQVFRWGVLEPFPDSIHVPGITNKTLTA